MNIASVFLFWVLRLFSVFMIIAFIGASGGTRFVIAWGYFLPLFTELLFRSMITFGADLKPFAKINLLIWAACVLWFVVSIGILVNLCAWGVI